MFFYNNNNIKCVASIRSNQYTFEPVYVRTSAYSVYIRTYCTIQMCTNTLCVYMYGNAGPNNIVCKRRKIEKKKIKKLNSGFNFLKIKK